MHLNPCPSAPAESAEKVYDAMKAAGCDAELFMCVCGGGQQAAVLS